MNMNISEIPKARSIFFDTSNYNNNLDYSTKQRPITSRLILKKHKLPNFTPKSPKISNYGFTTKSKPKMFSLIDIKDQYYSKSPDLPNQYKRIIYNNINDFLYDKNKRGLIFKIPQVETSFKKIKPTENEKQKFKMKKNKSEKTLDKSPLMMSRKERIYKPHCWDNATVEEIKKGQRDKLMPEGFAFYEKNMLSASNKNYIKNNYVKINKTKINNNKLNSHNSENSKLEKGKSQILLRKLIKLNQYRSNIFFLDKSNNNKSIGNLKKSINKNQRIIYSKYQDSDIFNLRNDKNIIVKSGEHSFFRDNNEKKYNVNNETLLGWNLRKPLPSFLNHASSQYNLLNSDMKNTSQTKESIIKEMKKVSDIYNPTHKQKGLTEFIELSRVSAANINVDYTKAINDDPNIFRKRNNLSTEFYDIFGHYRNICEKPFQKLNIFKYN